MRLWLRDIKVPIGHFFVDEYNSNEPWPNPSFSIPFHTLTVVSGDGLFGKSWPRHDTCCTDRVLATQPLGTCGARSQKMCCCTNDKLQNDSKWLRTIWRICWFFVGSRLSTSLLFFQINKCTVQLHACSFVRCSLSFAESEDYGNSKETVSAVQWCLWLKVKQQLATLHLLWRCSFNTQHDIILQLLLYVQTYISRTFWGDSIIISHCL